MSLGDRLMTDIVQQIDDALAIGERCKIYDTCPHCGRYWHGLPITQRVADMYMDGLYDETYRVDTDTSPVLCRGSDFIGPMTANAMVPSGPPDGLYLDEWLAVLERTLATEGADIHRRYRRQHKLFVWVWLSVIFINVLALLSAAVVIAEYKPFPMMVGVNLVMAVYATRMLINNRHQLRELTE